MTPQCLKKRRELIWIKKLFGDFFADFGELVGNKNGKDGDENGVDKKGEST